MREQEESSYEEYASYHQGEQGEGAAAFKSLVREEAGSLSNGLIEGPSSPNPSALMHDCIEHQSKAWCMRNASLLGEIAKGLVKAAKWTWKAIKKVVTSFTHWTKTKLTSFMEEVFGHCPPFQMKVGGQCLEPQFEFKDPAAFGG